VQLITQWHLRNAQQLFCQSSFQPKLTLPPHHPETWCLWLTKRDFEIPGLAPQLEYTYSKAWSNTPFDSFEAHGASVTLTKQF
jgi:Surface lipoprotein assembly modifier